jgi:hypothetical protein
LLSYMSYANSTLQIKESYPRTPIARCRNNWATSELLRQFIGNRRRAQRRREALLGVLVIDEDERTMDVDL